MPVVSKSDLQELSNAESSGTRKGSGEIAAVNAAARNLAIDVFRPELFSGKSYFAQLKIFEDVCEQVDSKAWEPCSDKLKSFVLARMEQKASLDLFLGEDVVEEMGGICHGMAEVWNAIHASNPNGNANFRMAILMTEKGMSYALASHKAYSAEFKKARNASSVQQQLQTIHWGDFQEKVLNDSSLCGSHAKLISQTMASTEKEYVAMAKKLSENRGYYQLSVYNKKNEVNGQNGAYAQHALRVFSNGSGRSPATFGYWNSFVANILSDQQEGRHLTVYDSKLGESRVLPEHMGVFMAELREFYKTSRNMNLIGIKEIHSIDIRKPIEETFLEGLGFADHKNRT